MGYRSIWSLSPLRVLGWGFLGLWIIMVSPCHTQTFFLSPFQKKLDKCAKCSKLSGCSLEGGKKDVVQRKRKARVGTVPCTSHRAYVRAVAKAAWNWQRRISEGFDRGIGPLLWRPASQISDWVNFLKVSAGKRLIVFIELRRCEVEIWGVQKPCLSLLPKLTDFWIGQFEFVNQQCFWKSQVFMPLCS